jgi:hypothetical protein
VARIFLSYRRDDSGGYAGRLYDRLSQHFGRSNLFMDIDTIALGLDFVEAIEEAVPSKPPPAAPAARPQPPVLSVPCGAGRLGHALVGCSPGWQADARRGHQREQRGMG